MFHAMKVECNLVENKVQRQNVHSEVNTGRKYDLFIPLGLVYNWTLPA